MDQVSWATTPGATTFGLWVAAGLTIAIYSFLYKDNPFYKLAEHIYIGASTGYLVVIAWNDALKPLLWVPLTNPRQASDYLAIIPGLLGLIMFTRFFRDIGWISRITLAFVIGYGSGVRAPAEIQAYLIRHTGTTMQPIFHPETFVLTPWSIAFAILTIGFFGYLVYSVESDQFPDWELGKRLTVISGTVLSTFLFFFSAAGWSMEAFMNSFYVLVIFVGVFSVLFYFFYSIEHKKSLKGVAKTGIIYLMIFFGSAFGYTVMGRVSLAIGRMRFLVNDWIKETTGTQWIIGLGVAAAIAIVLLLSERSSKPAE
mgnify:CR=1 FL=1